MATERIFKTAEEIFDKAVEYLKYLNDNPLGEEVFVGKEGRKEIKRLHRIPTWEGFAVFCGVASSYFREVKRDRGAMDEETHKRIVTILSRIGDMFYANKAEAASAGLANSAFIIHELGLRRQAEQLEANVQSGQLVIKVVAPKSDDEDDD